MIVETHILSAATTETVIDKDSRQHLTAIDTVIHTV